MIHAIHCGQVCCAASLEMPGEMTVLKAVRQASCKASPTDAELDAALNWLGDRLWIYDHIGDQKLKEVMDVLLYARRRYGATQLVIDSLMMLAVDSDDYTEQANITKNLKAFARDNNCHVHMVIHPRKAKDRGQSPESSDVKGSGTQTDAVDNVLLVWQNKKKLMAKRDLQLKGTPIPFDLAQEPDATLTIDKNRTTGWCVVIPLWFEENSCQYLPDSSAYPVLYAPCSGGHP
jgi:twinkle protein